MMADDPADALSRVDHAIDSIHQTIRDIRNFIRGLGPELLDEADLASGISSLAAEFTLNTLVDLEVSVSDLPVVAPDTAAHVLAMAREGLSNIVRHSGATRAAIDLHAADGTLRLVIGDNGRGFDVGHARSSRQHGLTNLHSRAEAVGGSLHVESEPGAGTRLEATIPLMKAG
jgi:signal transduction histidine kinase